MARFNGARAVPKFRTGDIAFAGLSVLTQRFLTICLMCGLNGSLKEAIRPLM